MDISTSEVSATIEPLLGAPLEAGDVGSVGDYRLIAKIGHGGMGVVYRGRKQSEATDLAIKVLGPTLVSSAKARQRFLREAGLTADLRHERLTGLVDLGDANGLPYIVMPLLRGETLEQRLQREPPPASELILTVARETAEGLAFAHSKGIIHRDIKPSNLWLEASDDVNPPDATAHVKILDLGLARRVDDDAHITSTGILLGTPEYMAPEHVRGEAGGERGDLFSLGCVLYRMATGSPPFRGSNLMAVLRSLALTQPNPPREINPAISQGLSDFIMTLIAKDPAERPASANDVCRTLDNIDEFRSSLRSDAAMIAMPPKPRTRRSRTLIPTLAAGLVVVCGALTVLVAGYWNGPKAETVIAEKEGGRNEPVVEKGIVEPPIEAEAPPSLEPVYDKEGELTAKDPTSKFRLKSHMQVHGVDLRGKKSYRIELKSTEFDAFLYLEDPNGVLLASDDDSGRAIGGLLNARIALKIPADGKYRVVATSFIAGAKGKYQLSIYETTFGESIRWRTQNFASLNPAERTKILKDTYALLDSRKPSADRDGAATAEAIVQQLDSLSSGDTVDHCARFGKYLAGSEDDKIQSTARWIAGVERRYRLPGTAIEVAGTPIGGGTFDWSAYRGKIVLLDFWASWCPYCVEEAPELKRHYQAFKDRGFEIVGVNVDQLPLAGIQFAKVHKLPWVSINGKAVVAETGRPFDEHLGVMNIPARILVDPAGKVITIHARGIELGKLLKQRLGQISESVIDLAGPVGTVTGVAFSPDGKRVVAGALDGSLIAWEIDKAKPIQTVKGHKGSINAVAFRDDGQAIATAGSDGAIKIWDAETMQVKSTIKGHAKQAMCVAFRHYGQRIVSGGVDGAVKIWDVATGNVLQSMTLHEGAVSSVEFSPDGSRVASGGYDMSAKIWDVENGRQLHELKKIPAAYHRVGWSADGSRLIGAAVDGVVRFSNPESGVPVSAINIGRQPMSAAAFSRDRALVACGLSNGDIMIVNLGSGKKVAEFMAHDGPVRGLAFSDDGSRLVSASSDRLIRVWNTTVSPPPK